MIVTIDCRDIINCKVTIVLCNGAQDFVLYTNTWIISDTVISRQKWELCRPCRMTIERVKGAKFAPLPDSLERNVLPRGMGATNSTHRDFKIKRVQYTLLKSDITRRDHMVCCHGSHECWFTHRQFHSQFHSRRQSSHNSEIYNIGVHAQ